MVFEEVKSENISALIQSKVNVHGELHLDAVQAKILIAWLVRIEDSLVEYSKIAEELEKVHKILTGDK